MKQPEKNTSETMFLLRRFREFMAGSGARYLGSILSVAVTVLTSFLTPLLIAGAVDAVTDTLNGAGEKPVNLPAFFAGWFNARGGSEYLARHIWIVAALLIAVSLLGGLFQYLRGKWSAEASESIAERMRQRLYSHLLDLNYDYHVKAETGDLIQRCTTDVETVRRFLASQVIEIFRTVIMVVLALSLMSSIHGPLTLISLILIPPLFGLAFWFFHWVQKLFLEADEADGKLSAMLQESLTGVRVVRAFGRQRYESDRFTVCADAVHDKSVRISRVMAVYWSGSDMLSMAQTGMTLLFGIYFATKGEITTGNVLTFVSYISMLIWPIRQLGRILQDLGKSIVAMRRIYEILDTPAEADTPGAGPAPLYADIEFKNVGFGYDSRHPILKDVSFTVKAGQTVAILGATGSGKSTMMNLLQRLYDAKTGEILIGGRDIRTIEKKYLRGRVGYVLQEPFLYSRSIRDNLAITREDATPEELDRVARITHSDGFIRQFKEGYDTLVGERGVTLSGGQKQRIAIARTLLRENDILILDDSLSAVDTETDRAIREALVEGRSRGGRVPTTFIISHRLTTLADADLILVLEDGKIAQQGTHEQLIHVDGLYQRVYRIQAALEDELNREVG
ncbi:MAG: ABC transporter ATP-binding protein [Clostridia bacterium]|nr:ABC transporter ATP-binding protein [Clostridia bacterium]